MYRPHFQEKERTTMSGGMTELDMIEELRLRRWARENYSPPEQRQSTWHPVVHEEMTKKDLELTAEPIYA
jgi:hypothetical protein